MDVGVVGFPVVGVLVLIGGGSVGQFASDGILVGLREVALCVRQACHTAPGVVEVVGSLRCLVKQLHADPVHAVGVGGVSPSIDVLLHQHFHVLPVHVIDILDQLIFAVQHGACGGDEPDQFLLRGADLAV